MVSYRTWFCIGNKQACCKFYCQALQRNPNPILLLYESHDDDSSQTVPYEVSPSVAALVLPSESEGVASVPDTVFSKTPSPDSLALAINLAVRSSKVRLNGL